MVKHSFSSTPKDLELNLRIILEDLAQEKIKKTRKLSLINTDLFTKELLKIM